jgi:hypothetical protein
MSNAGMPVRQPAPPRREHLSRARLLAGDALVAVRLFQEVRHRIMRAVFGVSRADSNLVWVFAIGAFAAALRRGAAAPGAQVRKARSSPTAVGDTMIGAAVASETLDSIAGHPARDTSFAAALIALALAVHSFRPGLERSLRAALEAYRELTAAAHRVREVMRRWGISNLPEPLAQTLRPAAEGDDRAPRDSSDQ